MNNKKRSAALRTFAALLIAFALPSGAQVDRLRTVIETPRAEAAGAVLPTAGSWGSLVRVRGAGFARAESVRAFWYPGNDTRKPPVWSGSVTLRGRRGTDEIEVQIPLDPGRAGARGEFAKGALHIVLQMPGGQAPVYAGAYTIGGAAPADAPTKPGARPAERAPKPLGPGGYVSIVESGGSTDVVKAGATDSYDIVLSKAPAGDVEIAVSADHLTEVSTDGQAFSASVALTLNARSPRQTITVRALNAQEQGSYSSTIRHAIAASADPALYPPSLAINAVVARVTSPGVSLRQPGSRMQVREGGAAGSYQIALDTRPAGDVEILISADYQLEVSTDGEMFASSALLTFSARDATTPRTITVRAVDDTDQEGAHTGSITHAIVASADPSGYPRGMAIGDVTVDILDND